MKMVCISALFGLLVGAASEHVTRSEKRASQRKSYSSAGTTQALERWVAEAEDDVTRNSTERQKSALERWVADAEHGTPKQFHTHALELDCVATCSPAYFKADARVTVDALIKRGMRTYRWVNPGESVLFEGVLTNVLLPSHGGFLYQRKDGSAEWCSTQKRIAKPFRGAIAEGCDIVANSELGRFTWPVSCHLFANGMVKTPNFYTPNSVLLDVMKQVGLVAYRFVKPGTPVTLNQGHILKPQPNGGFLYRTDSGSAVFCLGGRSSTRLDDFFLDLREV